MKTPNEIVNEIQSAIAEETTKGIYSDSILRVTDILRRVQNEAYSEGQSQAVQREREAAKGLAERLTIAIEQLEAHRGLFDPTIIRAHKSVLATYNDNRKG
jgi:hypothetical protein